MICGYVRVCAGISQPRGKNCHCVKKGEGAEITPQNPAHTRKELKRIRSLGFSVRKIKEGWAVRAPLYSQILSDAELASFAGPQ